MAEPSGSVADRPAARTVRMMLRLDRMAHRRWFLPTVAAFPLSDYLLPILPNQILLISLSMLHPRRWWRIAATFIIATTLGAFLLALTIQTAVGPWLLDTLLSETADDSVVPESMATIENYGLWVLVGLSLLPWPPRIAVVACALVGLPPWAIALAVLVGRPVPAVALAFTGAKAPRLLRRLRTVDRVLTEVEANRTTPS